MQRICLGEEGWKGYLNEKNVKDLLGWGEWIEYLDDEGLKKKLDEEGLKEYLVEEGRKEYLDEEGRKEYLDEEECKGFVWLRKDEKNIGMRKSVKEWFGWGRMYIICLDEEGWNEYWDEEGWKEYLDE